MELSNFSEQLLTNYCTRNRLLYLEVYDSEVNATYSYAIIVSAATAVQGMDRWENEANSQIKG